MIRVHHPIDHATRLLYLISVITITISILSIRSSAQRTEPSTAKVRLIICPYLTTDILVNQSYPNIEKLARGGSVGLISYASTPHNNPLSAIASTYYGEAMELYNPPRTLNLISVDANAVKRIILFDMSSYDRNNHHSLSEMICRSDNQSEIELYAWRDDNSQTLAHLLADHTPYSTSSIPCGNIPVVAGMGDKSSQEVVLASLDNFLHAISIKTSADLVTILMSPTPISNRKGVWTRLPMMIISGGEYAHGEVSSSTTRTIGLISNLDIAPTIQKILGERINPFFTGHPIQSFVTVHPFEDVTKLDHAITLNQQTLIPGGALLGVVVSLFVFGGMLSERRKSRLLAPCRFGILCMMTMPISMFIVASELRQGDIINVKGYLLTLFAIMTLLGVVVTLITRLLFARKDTARQSETTLAILGFITIGVIAYDSFTGQTMVKYALISGYQLSGIRFYGIGNEFMGFFIGMSLLGIFLSRPPSWLAVCVFCFCTAVLVAPSLGAKAGAALVCLVAYGAASISMTGRTFRWKTVCLLLLAGILLIIGVGMLEEVAFPHHASHIGAALSALHARGYGYFVDIILRKVMMNIRLSVSPGMLATYLGLIIAWAFKRMDIREMLLKLKRSHPNYYTALPSVGWGSLVALVFNDSGVVAAIFLVGVFITGGIYLLWSPST